MLGSELARCWFPEWGSQTSTLLWVHNPSLRCRQFCYTQLHLCMSDGIWKSSQVLVAWRFYKMRKTCLLQRYTVAISIRESQNQPLRKHGGTFKFQIDNSGGLILGPVIVFRHRKNDINSVNVTQLIYRLGHSEIQLFLLYTQHKFRIRAFNTHFMQYWNLLRWSWVGNVLVSRVKRENSHCLPIHAKLWLRPTCITVQCFAVEHQLRLSLPVRPFSKLNKILSGYFDPDKDFLK